MNKYDWRAILLTVSVAAFIGAIGWMLSGCVSLHSDEVTAEHWAACQRYCAPTTVRLACDSWKGNGCQCDDRREIFFDLEEFEE